MLPLKAEINRNAGISKSQTASHTPKPGGLPLKAPATRHNAMQMLELNMLRNQFKSPEPTQHARFLTQDTQAWRTAGEQDTCHWHRDKPVRHDVTHAPSYSLPNPCSTHASAEALLVNPLVRHKPTHSLLLPDGPPSTKTSLKHCSKTVSLSSLVRIPPLLSLSVLALPLTTYMRDAGTGTRNSASAQQWDVQWERDIYAVATEAGLSLNAATSIVKAARKGSISRNPGVILSQVGKLPTACLHPVHDLHPTHVLGSCHQTSHTLAYIWPHTEESAPNCPAGSDWAKRCVML